MNRLLFLLPLLALLGACAPEREETPLAAGRATQVADPLPPPTENWLGDDAERRNRKGRREWMADMHRAAPGVDWKAIERANGERLTRLRAEARGGGFGIGDWTERGSRNLAGRMHAVALSLDGNHLYGGSSRGGVWKGTLDGRNWEPISDNLWGGAHHVAVASSPAEVVLSLTDGGRLAVTVDGGQTWTTPGGIPGDLWEGIHLQTDPADTSRVYLVATGGDYWNREHRLYRSADGGLTFQLLREMGPQHSDLWFDRVSGGPIYLLEGRDLLRSDNNGDSWQAVGTVRGEPTDRVVLAGSEAGAPALYAALRDPDDHSIWLLYRSVDAGAAWEYRWQITDFWQTMTASIGDPDVLVTGGVEVFRSDDGGNTFSLVNPWGQYYQDPVNRLHADVPGMDVLMIGPTEVFYTSTDGGLYRSDDRMASVLNISLEGLGVSQYYTTHTSINDPDLVLAGAQDQGYQRTSDASQALMAFDQLISGDYGHLTSGDGTHEWIYSVYPGFVLVQEGEQDPSLRQLDFPAGEDHLWMPFILADPTDREAFYFCASRLYRYQRNPASDEWTSYRVSEQPFLHDDARFLTALSISPVDTDRFIAINDKAILYYSSDGGANWTRSLDTGPSGHYFYGNAFAHSPRDPLTAYLGGSGYSGPAVYRTHDGGATWSPVSTGLPSTLVYDLTYESPQSDYVYAATEAGPYRLDPSSDTWEYIGGTTAPLTTWWTVEAVPRIGVVRFGTYGRGIWDYQATGSLEICHEDIDNDGDTLVGCEDPDCIGLDSDGDTTDDCLDCAFRDPALWSPAAEPVPVTVETVQLGLPGVVAVRWTPGDPGGDAGQVFDVIAGELSDLHADGWPAPAACLVDDKDGTAHVDFQASVARWYLVVGQNGCGAGSLGADSDAVARTVAGGCP